MPAPLPDGLTFEEWVSAMINEFSAQLIPAYYHGQPWQEWVDGAVKDAPFFAQDGVPDSAGFEQWDEWAERAIGALAQ